MTRDMCALTQDLVQAAEAGDDITVYELRKANRLGEAEFAAIEAHAAACDACKPVWDTLTGPGKAILEEAAMGATPHYY